MACISIKSNKHGIIFVLIHIFAILLLSMESFFVLFPLKKIEYHTYTVEHNVIDVVLSTDSTYKPGIYALINSIILNTNSKNIIYFHLLLEHKSESDMIEKELNLLFDEQLKSFKFIFEMKSFDQYPTFYQFIKNNWRQPDSKYQQHSHVVMTYGRLFMAHIFTNLQKVIYCDADVIFQTDISQLYLYDTTKTFMWAVFPDDGTHKIRHMFDDNIDALKHVGLYEPWMHNRQGFNPGIHLVNLTAWKQHNLTQKSQDIMIYNKGLKDNLLHYEDACILQIIFAQNGLEIGHLNTKWNVLHLGWQDIAESVLFTNSLINEGYALHWSGQKKPWYKSFHFNELHWKKYIPKKFDNQTISKWNKDWLSYHESKNT